MSLPPNSMASILRGAAAAASSAAVPVRVLYHCPCRDGIFSALAAYLHFKDRPEFDVKFVPHYVYKSLDAADRSLFPEKSHVYLLDYSGPEPLIPALCQTAEKVVLVDHHKTAFELLDAWKAADKLPRNFHSSMRLDMSGATLSYAYFSLQQSSPLIASEQQRNRLARIYAYVEDVDLWRNALPGFREFSSGYASIIKEHDISLNPSLFDSLLNMDVDDLIAKGKTVIEEEKKLIEAELPLAFPVALGGRGADGKPLFGECLAVVTRYPDYRSQMGNDLAVLSQQRGYRGMSAVVYTPDDLPNAELRYKVSLRSLGTEDSAVISKAFGGGGHLNASSFIIDKAVFDTWRKAST